MTLTNKVAVLTGACGGIGSAVVDKLISQGARVVLADMNIDGLKQLSDKYPETTVGIATDVTDYSQVEAAINTAVEHFGRVDIVINNAGIAFPKMLLEHNPEEDFDLTINVNQKGVYYGILAAAKKFVAMGTPGVIINTSSVYGQMAAEMSFIYNASKAAVDMMTKCAALELAPHNIRVCAVAPGRVDTPLLRKYDELGLWDHIRKEQMRNTFTQPEEIAAIFAFLASDEANVINGNTVNADDGFVNFKFPLIAG